MSTFKSLVLPAICSVFLFAGCNPESPDLPSSPGVSGMCADGWEYFHNGQYDEAMESFQDAIDADVTYSEAYLGAGWTSIFLSDYWVIADNFFYMALQLDGGTAPLVERSGTMVQDTMWTVFECLDPDLPPAVLDPILAHLADSGAAWVGDSIFSIVYDSLDTNANIPYRFHVEADGAAAMFLAFNNFSNVECPVDSIVSDGEGDYWVYILGTYKRGDYGGVNIRTWISADNVMTFDYVTFEPGTVSQTSLDAMAGLALLQHAKGVNGDRLLGCAAVRGLYEATTGYSFGAGTDHAGYVDLNDVSIMGTAAGLPFADQYFRYAWFCCRLRGYALDLDPRADDFVPQLMTEIESMLAY